jgi:glycosyltransferase involved in cell wall biosynthesis
MRILLLTDGIAPFVLGGMQKHSRLLAEYLASNGVETTLFHYCERPLIESEVRAVFSDQANANLAIHNFLYQDNSKLPGHYLRAQKQMSKSYLQTLKELPKFDFIYAKGFMAWELLKQRDALKISAKVGVKLHGMNMFLPTHGIKEKLEQYIFRVPAKYCLDRADIVFSYGGKVSDVILKTGVPKNKIVEMPTGLEANWTRNTPLKTYLPRKILFVGRYDHVKGIRELNDFLSSSDGGYEMHFIGDIPSQFRFKKPFVFYHGVINDPQRMMELMDEMDALILPSYSEGMPNVVLEAMARGLVILATNVGAMSILVNSYNSILMENSDINSIRKGIDQFLSIDDQILLQMKHKSLHQAASLQWETIINRLLEQLRIAVANV